MPSFGGQAERIGDGHVARARHSPAQALWCAVHLRPHGRDAKDQVWRRVVLVREGRLARALHARRPADRCNAVPWYAAVDQPCRRRARPDHARVRSFPPPPGRTRRGRRLRVFHGISRPWLLRYVSAAAPKERGLAVGTSAQRRHCRPSADNADLHRPQADPSFTTGACPSSMQACPSPRNPSWMACNGTSTAAGAWVRPWHVYRSPPPPSQVMPPSASTVPPPHTSQRVRGRPRSAPDAKLPQADGDVLRPAEPYALARFGTSAAVRRRTVGPLHLRCARPRP